MRWWIFYVVDSQLIFLWMKAISFSRKIAKNRCFRQCKNSSASVVNSSSKKMNQFSPLLHSRNSIVYYTPLFIWSIKLLLPTKTVGWRACKTIFRSTITTCSSPSEWQRVGRKSMSVHSHTHTQRRKFRVKIRSLSHAWSRNETEIVKRENEKRDVKKSFIEKGSLNIPHFLCRTFVAKTIPF